MAQPRHGGFGAVATVTEETINDAILSYARQEGPFFWPLPKSIPVGGLAFVRLAGLMEMLPPVIELHPDAANRATADFTFRSTLRAAPSGQRMKKWTIQWKATGQASVVAAIQAQQITLSLDTASIVFNPLQVTVVKGAPLPPPILAALTSTTVANAITAFVRSRPLTIAPPMLRSVISMTQGIDLPWVVGPNWFTVNLVVSRIVVRTLEDALTLAVDFQGITNGNDAQLVDLTKVAGSGVMYYYTITPDSDANLAPQTGKDEDGNTFVTFVDLGPPKLSAKSEPAGGDIACALNMKVLSHVTKAQISPQVSDTMIYPDIVLQSVALRYTPFYKPLVGTQIGLALDFHVTVQKGTWFGVDGTIYLQVYRQQADGPTEFIYQVPETWRFYVSQVVIDLPGWVDVAVAVLAISFSLAFPLLSGMVAVMAGALIGEIIPALVEDIEKQAQNGLSSGANSQGIDVRSSSPLPGLTAPLWNRAIKYLCTTAESIDIGIITYPDHDLSLDPVATISPMAWPASSRQLIPTAVVLREDFAKLGATIKVKWTVRRGDTLKVIASATKAYDDPAGNGVLIPHHSKDLYQVDKFIVRCTLQFTMDGQTGEIWTGVHTVSISDYVDRHHKYVEWGLHKVHFKNEGTGGYWWQHTRRSRIHRTAVSARCRMLKKIANEHASAFTHGSGKGFTTVTYLDALPFPWEALNSHRKPLCEYCFFGGPEKWTALPEHDWF